MPLARPVLRERLLKAREPFVTSPDGQSAQQALATHLQTVLAELEPECLGAYWPVRFEFNAAPLWHGDRDAPTFSLALPFARREPRQMHYRRWDGRPPALADECGIATSDGAEVVPDVVLVPCVGFTREGFRLGYGGGYFDRWLAAHPQVTAVGVSWSVGEVATADFEPEAHDQPLMLVVTEQGVVG